MGQKFTFYLLKSFKEKYSTAGSGGSDKYQLCKCKCPISTLSDPFWALLGFMLYNSVGRPPDPHGVLCTHEERHLASRTVSSNFFFLVLKFWELSVVKFEWKGFYIAPIYFNLMNLDLREAILSKKCSFFEHCSKGLWPPPFYLNICPILQGVFFKRVFEH